MTALSDARPAVPQPILGRPLVAVNLLGLALLLWGVWSNPVHPHEPLAVALLSAGAGAGWLGWLVARNGGLGGAGWLVSLGAMVVCGAALAVFAPPGMVFVGVGALGAALRMPLSRAIGVGMAGPAVMLATLPAAGHHNLSPAVGAAAASLAGVVMGLSRRQTQDAAARVSAIQLAEARADAEQARAELLAGRNHMARELHDVLAHTLSALSLQLEALSALMRDQPDPRVADQLDRIRRLVREGIDEAGGAVRALREDLPPLDTRLSALAAEREAELCIDGQPRPLPPDVGLALYRVAQEALTNAAKHAAGGACRVGLAFDPGRVRLSVQNLPGLPQPHLGSTGYGLEGIKERMLLLGGSVTAGPPAGGEGWVVEAEVPA